jgi:hypothetical protein
MGHSYQIDCFLGLIDFSFDRRPFGGVHDETIDHFKSEFVQLAEHVLTQSHQDAVNPAFDAVDPMHDAATLAAQHAHHFLV